MRALSLMAILAIATTSSSGPPASVQAEQPAENPPVSALLFLADRVQLPALAAEFDQQRATLRQRHKTVVNALRDKAAGSQQALINLITNLQNQGQVRSYRPFWVANAIRVDAPQTIIDQLAAHPDVQEVYPNHQIELIAPVERQGPARAAQGGGIEPGLLAINADEVWALGYTGAGVLVANIDTGVDGDHPALASRWAGTLPQYANHPEWAWFDPFSGLNDFPYDGGSGFGFGHGTHTMGSVCGGAPGDQIGVAPGAHWIAAGAIDRGGGVADTVADAIEAFQWIIDPDGNAETNWDVPAVCSNSWGVTSAHGYPPCDPLFWSYLDACEAAGIVILFSAGNEGPSPSSLRRPGDRATDALRTFAVGAAAADAAGWPIADFSSRGPSDCTPGGTDDIKPEVVAPGVDIRSAAPGGGYTIKDGTSMASPHVNGVVALMREACPDLTVQQVKQVLLDTAVDLGPPGEDNAYGWGMIDAYQAVLGALDLCGPSPPLVQDGYLQTPVDTELTLALQATDTDGEPQPISYIIVSLPAHGTLRDAGDSHLITAGELPYTLAANANQVTYLPAPGYYGEDLFGFKATDGGVPPEGGESDTATVTILMLFDPPQIDATALPDGVLNVAYGPYAVPVLQGQPPLAWITLNDEYLEVNQGPSQFHASGTAQGWHADDSSWQYALPFAFPYYGEEYTTVWICSNGFVNLSGPDNTWSNNQSGLISATRIAPLWDDLRTNFGDTDIYIQTLADRVIIRWDAVTYSGQQPCNFSCALFTDGTIRFEYGDGNQPLTPTVGISKGDGEHYLLSDYDGAGSLDLADTHDMVQPVPLPDGLALSPEGLVSGIPLQAGSFEPRFRVVDSLGRSDEQTLALVVLDQSNAADLSGNGTVDAADLALLLGAWGPNLGDPADLNSDGTVDAADLALLLAAWG